MSNINAQCDSDLHTVSTLLHGECDWNYGKQYQFYRLLRAFVSRHFWLYIQMFSSIDSKFSHFSCYFKDFKRNHWAKTRMDFFFNDIMQIENITRLTATSTHATPCRYLLTDKEWISNNRPNRSLQRTWMIINCLQHLDQTKPSQKLRYFCR